jgi:uncharacterized protein YggU (UPF0235/DUF167 family)
MKIFVKVKPNAYEEKVEKIDDNHFNISVVEPPANGLANRGVVKVLADYMKIAPSRIRVAKGFTSKQKVVEII